MKLIAFLMMMAFATPIVAQQASDDLAVVQDNKTEIKAEELPEVITAALEEGDYEDWTVEKAFKIVAEDQTTYELHLVMDEETLVLLADDQGNLSEQVEG